MIDPAHRGILTVLALTVAVVIIALCPTITGAGIHGCCLMAVGALVLGWREPSAAFAHVMEAYTPDAADLGPVYATPRAGGRLAPVSVGPLRI